jgi:hypothetical protein
MLNHSATVDYSKITTIQPGKRSGKRYSRHANYSAGCFEYLAGGMTELFVALA